MCQEEKISALGCLADVSHRPPRHTQLFKEDAPDVHGHRLSQDVDAVIYSTDMVTQS